MAQLTEQDLQGIVWSDFAILKREDNTNVLVLICENQQQSDKLFGVITSHRFNLGLYINEKKQYSITLEFANSEYGIRHDTGQTEQSYPPIGWLAKSQVQFISTGIRGNGNQVLYRQDVHPIDQVNLN